MNALYARVFRFFLKSRFRHFGKASSIVCPSGIEGAENISIGDDVYISHKTYLAAVPHTGESECKLEIGSGSRIGRFNHIYATYKVILREKVLTANGVYISDNLHDYRDASIPIMDQPILQNRYVEIGEGTWLGHNACILGARVGRNCVVGANAVVTSDIPDFSIVVGAPAVIIKRFDEVMNVWKPTHPDGKFI